MPAATGSLRTKLMLWFALVFLAIDAGLVAAISIAREDAFESVLVDEARLFTTQLASNIVTLERSWTQEAPASPDELEAEFPHSSFDPDVFPAGVVLRDERWNIVGSTRLERPDALPMSIQQAMVRGPVLEVVDTIDPEESREILGHAVEHRMWTMPIYLLDPPRIEYLQVVVPVSSLTPSLAVYTDIILWGIVIGGAISLLAAWLVAGRIVAPIEHLARAARQVRPDRLSRRLRVDAPSTEMAELQRELNHALERLEIGYRAQERFIGDVSHELRTPLAVLLAEAGLLRPEATGPERLRAFVESTEEELRRLARLVEGFLRLTRVEMAREDLLMKEVEVNDLVVDATRNVESYARRSGTHLVPSLALPDDEGDGPVVHGDPELLRTMLENLIRNAVRFSPTGAPVTIEVERDGSDVLIIVRDKGPGIPPENLERVFERFVRLEENGEREKGGSGIGLSIARNITGLHHGTITASNAPGGGCVMTVRLPLGDPLMSTEEETGTSSDI